MLFKVGERVQSERCKTLVVLADAREAVAEACPVHRGRAPQGHPPCVNPRSTLVRFHVIVCDVILNHAVRIVFV